MRKRLRKLLAYLFHKTDPPPPNQATTIAKLNDTLIELASRENNGRSAYMERCAELVEARAMCGSGPWQVSPAASARVDQIMEDALARYGKPGLRIHENANISSQIDLMLQNVEWRRDLNYSQMEFSRWGIQEIILISRLYYIKHPWIRRAVNLSAAYVFGQGVELSSPDPDANDTLKRFRERNKVALGQIALTEQEKRKFYDGNLFWCLFPDTQDKGETNVRLIDATEIQEVVCDPNDQEKPRFYKRLWSGRQFDETNGTWINTNETRWYPALGYEPELKPPLIAGHPVAWESPIRHRKVGMVASWGFGCPREYPALDWCREGRRHLEACASVTQAHSQIALEYTTKGGQHALAGFKQQMQTSVNSTGDGVWDENPPSTAAIFASGPGSKLQAFKSRGYGADPAEIKEFRNMVACCMEIPPTWLGDMETSNLSTAQTLDRPTELGFLSKQEEWQEDLTVMGIYALKVSKGAPSGKLREALTMRKVYDVEIREAGRRMHNGHWVYEAAKEPNRTIEVLCNFPAIREGDIPSLVSATCEAITEGNLDPKAGVRKLYDLLGMDNGDALTEEQYPEASYDPDKTKEPPEVEPALTDPRLRKGIQEALRRLKNGALEHAASPN